MDDSDHCDFDDEIFIENINQESPTFSDSLEDE
jgi:hypothetical protein